MRYSSVLLAVAAAVVASAENILRSTSLNTCQKNSKFTASFLNIVYTPKNGSAYVHITGVSSIEGYATFDVTITAYGYEFFHRTVDPCEVGLLGLCPMVAAKVDEPPFILPVSGEAVQQIPGIAYSFPDLDATVRVFINMTSGGQAGHAAACLELRVSNGKTVDLVSIQWASAAVILAALLAAAAIDQLGHFNAASHVAVHTLALFSYFQAQAMVGLCGMPLPPSVQAWTQDFQWSLGLIKLKFMQSVLTWYQRATGGTPTSLISSLSDVSVSVQRRYLVTPTGVATTRITRRGVTLNSSGSFVVTGIQRAAFLVGIEPTNAFLTVIGFFTALLVFAALAAVLFRAAIDMAVRAGFVDGRGERTQELLHNWPTFLKGIIFRFLLAAYPALAIFSFWELTQEDSPAEIVDAVLLLLAVSVALFFGAYRVTRIASRSIALHRNAAYILFSDPNTLNKWGCFYVQFRASAYYFAVPQLAHTIAKAAFLGFSQHSGITQAIGLILIETAALIAACVFRPWMDKITNSFNITICSVNFINAIILLFFSDVFNQPALATGIVGLVFWILNAVVTLVLLLVLIITTAVIFFRNNPDARYQFMADDRTSFVKSQVQLGNTELDDLAATARAGYASVHDTFGTVDDRHSRLLMFHDADERDSMLSDDRPNFRQRTRMPEGDGSDI